VKPKNMNPGKPAREFTRQASDGTGIHCYEWPLDKPRGIVQIVHGGAEHAGRYQPFAEALNEQGYGVLAADNRGHGKTAGLNDGFGDMGPANSLENVCDDVAALGAWARDQYPGVPLVIFGHSIGSLITQRVLIDHGDYYAAAILSGSPSVDVLHQAKPLVEQALQQAGRNVPAEELQMAMFSSFMESIDDPRTPFDWLSRDPAEVDKYIEDGMCGFALSLGAWFDIAEAGPLTASQVRYPGVLRRPA